MDADRPRRSSQTSPWTWIGCGCGLLVMLGLAGVTGMTWMGYKAGKKMARAEEDPAVRADLVREVLAYDELPAGYHPVGSFSMPMLVDVAILSDRPPERGSKERRGLGERGFLYMRMHGWMGREDELRRFLEGKGEKPEWMGGTGAEAEVGEVLGRGSVDAGGRQILYMATRGDLRLRGESGEGLVTWLGIDCPSDRRTRVGLWFVPDPAPGRPLRPADLADTPADPEAIQEFARHFRFCG